MQALLCYIKSTNRTIDATNKSMLAEMAGVSRMYLNRNKQAIDTYFNTATPATVHDIERC